MEYCIFSAQYLPHMGGVERYTYNLAKKLAGKGHGVTIVTSRVAESPAYEENEGIRVYRVPCIKLMDGRYPVLIPNAEFRKIHRIISGKRYDMIIVNTRFYVHSLYAAIFAKRQNTRCIFIEHGTSHMTVHNPILDFFENIVEHSITAAEKLLCKEYYGVSEACLDWLKHFHIQGKGTLYNAIDPIEIERKLKDSVCDYRQKFQIPEDGVVVTFTGRLLKEKGILTLLQAVENLNQKGMKLYLFIAGDGDEEKTVNSAKSDHIFPLGRISADEVVDLLKGTDIFCLPSDSEGMSTSVLEAVACRNFVVTTRKGGAREIIINSSYGTIMEDNQLETVEKALKEAAVDPELRQKAAEASYRRLEQYFTWDIVADKLIKLSQKN